MEENASSLGMMVLLLAALTVLFSLWSSRDGSPVLAILNRWLRWLLIAVGLAFTVHYFGWSARPFWALALMAFLGWFLLETAYNWLLIQAISRSDIPLFPEFRRNEAGDEWPAESRYLRMRDWLRRHRFRKRQSLKAELFAGSELRSTIYDSDDGAIRLQVLFVPRREGTLSACAVFSSVLEDGRRLVSDNIFMPFGGFYPENWHLARHPLQRSLNRLYKLHRRRLERESTPCVSWSREEEPLEDLNEQQKMLEKVNTDMGFLFPRYLREEHGKFTQSGRYRVWLEIWLLSYFGKTVSTRS